MDYPTSTIITAAIAAVASVVSAIVASRSKNTASTIERQMKIRQARMDERDLIQADGGFLIPIDNDQLWRDYFRERSNNRSRKEASFSVKERIQLSTDELVREPVLK